MVLRVNKHLGNFLHFGMFWNFLLIYGVDTRIEKILWLHLKENNLQTKKEPYMDLLSILYG